jgi:hypothetical protein
MGKMLISHRGNLTGREPELENCPEYIQAALDKGFWVEVDLFCELNGVYYLGHDKPEHCILVDFLEQSRLIVHCKTLNALESVQGYNIHYFYHENDPYTVTSQGLIWCLVGRPAPSRNGIVCLPEGRKNLNIENAAGICSDFIANYAPLTTNH